MTFPGIFPTTFFKSAAVAASSIITSIQPYEIIIASGATTNTATITATDATRTVIFPAHFTQSNANTSIENSRARVTLTDPTTITVVRTGTVGDVTVRGAAVEFNSGGVESVQYGVTTFASANLTATTTISSANMGRSAIFYLGHDATNGSTTVTRYQTTTVTLTNPTTITAQRDDGSASFFGATGWVLAKFNSGVATVQHQMFTSTSAGLAESHAIPTQINTARTILAWGGNRGASSTEQEFYHRIQLASSAAVTVTRGEGSTDTHSVGYNVIEFDSSYINAIQRGAITILSSALSGTASITSASTAKSALSYGGFSTGGDQANEQESTAKISNATTVTAEKGVVSSIGGDSATVAWEVVSFI